MWRLVYETAKLFVGQGGKSTVDLAFVDENGFVHQLLVVGDEVVTGPVHQLSAHAGYCSGVVGDKPNDM